MDLSIVLGKILIIVLVITSLVTLFHYLKISTIIGFILSGIFVGPHCFKLINSIPGAEIVSELATVLLLFTVGLEFSFSDIKKMIKKIFTLGVTQIFFTTAIFMIILKFMNLTWSQSFFIGFLLSLSSTAIIMRLLQSTREFNSPYGTAAIVINMTQDFATIPVILAIPLLATASSFDINYSYSTILWWLLKFASLCLFFFLATKWILPFAFEKVIKTHTKELFIFLLAVLCFGTGLLTHYIGMSLGLGGFLAGIMIAESTFNRQAISDVMPFRDMILGVFFISIGMLLDIKFLIYHFHYIVLFVTLIIIIKMLVIYFIAKMNRYSSRMSFIISMFFIQTSELSLILAQTASSMKFLKEEHMQYIISISVITMTLTPLLFNLFADKLINSSKVPSTNKKGLSDKFSFLPSFSKIPLLRSSFVTKIYNNMIADDTSSQPISSVGGATPEIKDHTIIIGYGVVGGNLASILDSLSLPYYVIEQNYSVVKHLQEKGVNALFGDATSSLILEDAGLERAKLVVVAVSGIMMSKDVIYAIRRVRKDVKIIARIQYSRQAQELQALNLKNLELVVAEYETTVELIAKSLTNYKIPIEDIYSFIEKTRSKFDQKSNNISDYFRKVLNLPEWGFIPEIKPFMIKSTSSIIGKTIKELNFRALTGATIVTMYRENLKTFVPNPDEVFQAGDILHILADESSLQKVVDLLG